MRAILLLFLFSVGTVFGQITVNGVNYSLNTDGVTYKVDVGSCYVGDLDLGNVIYNGNPITVTSIQDNAFSSCTTLTSVNIPNSITFLGGYSFSACTALSSVNFSNNLTTIGAAAFFQCSALTSVSIPDSVTLIGNSAFESCTQLNTVVLPSSIPSIGQYTFFQCSSLQNITIPNSVTVINSYAFGSCTSLTEVFLPNSVTSLGNNAYHNVSNMHTLVLPSSLTYVGNSVFFNCTGLNTVYCFLVNPISVNSNFFANLTQSNCALQVPVGSLPAYQSAAVWQNFAPIQEGVVCGGFQNFIATNTTGVEVLLSWEDNGANWDLEYKNINDANFTSINNVTQNSYTFNNLLGGNYLARVRKSSCNGTTGLWSQTLSFSITSPSVSYVNANATGNNDGTSWQNAYIEVEDALNSFNVGSEIWVASGIYTPTNGTGRKKTFNLPNGTKLYGGFNGTETSISQRNPSTNITVLSGDLNGDDNTTITDQESTRQDNSYHIISLKGVVNNVVVDGFTLSGANANGTSLTTGTAMFQYRDDRGGAVYAFPYSSGSVQDAKFVNCIFKDNSGFYGALYAQTVPTNVNNLESNILLENCTINNNYTVGYGGFYFFGSNGEGIINNGKFESCLFYQNRTLNGGSCMYFGTSLSNGGNSASVNVDVINSTFANNIGVNGAVFTMIRANSTRIINSIIYNNGSGTPFSVTTTGSYLASTIVQGGQLGGVNANPLFTNAAANDFTLQATSPAINAGNNTYVTTASDLLGNNRIHNTTVDMGAYEYGSVLDAQSFNSFSDFSIYPNPATSVLNIAMNDEVQMVQVYSLDGKLVKETATKQVDVSTLQAGFYMVKITTSNNKVGVKKFVKK